MPHPASRAVAESCTEKRCGSCQHFVNDPQTIESIFRGLNVMSSGYASVRGHDGICNLHEVYLSHRDTCADFAPEGGA